MGQEDRTAEAEKVHRLLNQGAQLLAQGEAQKAITPLERALQLDPENVAVLINLGGAYVMTGQNKKAIPLLERASEAEPDNEMIWINLGAASLGNPVLATPEQQMKAIQAFEKALSINPAAHSVHYNLGLIFVDRGDVDLARAAFRQAIQVNPTDADARIKLRRLESAQQANTDDE